MGLVGCGGDDGCGWVCVGVAKSVDVVVVEQVIRVAIVDDNRGHFERTKHPG